MTETETIGESLPKECARVREIICQYREAEEMCKRLHGGGQANFAPAIAMMEAALRRADQAMITGDAGFMVAVFRELQGFEA